MRARQMCPCGRDAGRGNAVAETLWLQTGAVRLSWGDYFSQTARFGFFLCFVAAPADIDRMISAVSSVSLGNDCVGRIIDGRFTLLRWLGRTDPSSVFLTELEGDAPRKAAIKLIPADAVDVEGCIARWSEAGKLSHPHVMRVFHFGRCKVDGQDQLYVVTEYADEVLSEILAERALTTDETREMLGPVLEALSWLHARDLVHGHLKPSNIMVVDERLKLSADRLHTDGEFGRPLPSPSPYDAPEIVTGMFSPAADAWSLGGVIVEALTQQPPDWDRRQGGEPGVSALIPMPFFGIARECLQLDPARRLTVKGVRAALEPVPSRGPAGKSPGKPSPRARLMLLVGAMVVVGGAIAALVVSSHHEPTSPVAVTGDAAPQPAASQRQPQVQASPQATEARPQRQSAGPQTTVPEPKPRAAAPPPTAQSIPRAPAPAAEPPAPQPAASAAQSGSVVKGAVASQATPEVPQHILDGITGHIRVRIRVQVDAEGRVSNGAIDDEGPSRYFANKALEAARKWTFTPARANGAPVASTWMLHFWFGKTETTATSEETAP